MTISKQTQQNIEKALPALAAEYVGRQSDRKAKATANRCAAQQSRRTWERLERISFLAQYGLWGHEPEAKRLLAQRKKDISLNRE